MKNNKILDDKKFLVIGSGAYGTAISTLLLKKNKNVTIYGIDENEINDINKNSKNSKYFDFNLPKNLKATIDLKSSLKDADVVLFAVPSKNIPEALSSVVENLVKPCYFINLSKGMVISNEKFDLICNFIKEKVPKKFNLGVLKLSGPTFAEEIIEECPSKFVLASFDLNTSEKIKNYFEVDNIKIEISNKIESIEAVSIIKNPLAILMGIITGLNYKMNTKAFIFSESLDEIVNFLKLLNLDTSVAYSSAGVGDLFLTGNSLESRNFKFGNLIGKDNKLTEEILNSFNTLEGLKTIKDIENYPNSNLNLLKLLYNIIYNKKEPKKVLDDYFLKG